MNYDQFKQMLVEVLTPEQWNAINSKITGIKVQRFDNYKNQFQQKLDDISLEVLQSGITAQILSTILSGEFLKNLPGYSSNNRQVLRNVRGELKWVNLKEE